MTTAQPDFRYPIEVRFRDLDALGHVNNAVFFTYLEQARVAFWWAICNRTGLDGLNFIVARAECDYRRPIVLGDSLEARITVSDIGRTSFTLDYDLTAPSGDPLFARARTVQVAYDFARSKPVPVPSDLRHGLERFRATADVSRESGRLRRARN
jgi:acyl-CoA thioester hydrolase